MASNLFGTMRSFKGGIHPPEEKEQTADYPIQDFMDPENDVVFLMLQGMGAPSKPLVKVGERVLRYQLIGEPTGFVSSPVYSSVSGTVKAIKPMLHPNGSMVNAVIVENDHLYDEADRPYEEVSFDKIPTEEIRDRIKYSGIVGMGGAGFPTWIKLSPAADKKILHLLVNGTECEPYLTSDYRVMLEDPERVVKGALIARSLFPDATLHFCVESNKLKAIDRLNNYILRNFPDDDRINIVQLQTKYPQGCEKMLITAVTGEEVPSGGLPADAGCIVINIDTAVAIYRAVCQARPLLRRIVTVSGSMIERPGNYKVRIGTSVRELVEHCGLKEEPAKIICGGPMMGIAQTTLDVPIIKTSSSFVLLTEKEAALSEESPCIRCGRCADICPIHLRPYMLAELVQEKNFAEFDRQFGCECIECGSCSFVCPAKRHLTQNIKLGRKIGLANKKKKAEEAKK